jgi:hypothetical protein
MLDEMAHRVKGYIWLATLAVRELQRQGVAWFTRAEERGRREWTAHNARRSNTPRERWPAVWAKRSPGVPRAARSASPGGR